MLKLTSTTCWEKGASTLRSSMYQTTAICFHRCGTLRKRRGQRKHWTGAPDPLLNVPPSPPGLHLFSISVWTLYTRSRASFRIILVLCRSAISGTWEEKGLTTQPNRPAPCLEGYSQPPRSHLCSLHWFQQGLEPIPAGPEPLDTSLP